MGGTRDLRFWAWERKGLNEVNVSLGHIKLDIRTFIHLTWLRFYLSFFLKATKRKPLGVTKCSSVSWRSWEESAKYTISHYKD